MPPPCFQRPWRSISWVGAQFWTMCRAMPTRPLWPLKNSQSASADALAIPFTRLAICDADRLNILGKPVMVCHLNADITVPGRHRDSVLSAAGGVRGALCVLSLAELLHFEKRAVDDPSRYSARFNDCTVIIKTHATNALEMIQAGDYVCTAAKPPDVSTRE